MRVDRPLPVYGQAPRITELWAWTAIDPMTDTEGIISARMPGGKEMPLVTSMRDMADRLATIAGATVAAAEPPRPSIRLRHFVEAD